MLSNNAPAITVSKTGSRGSFAWACGYDVPGEYETRLPMSGAAYRATKSVRFFGKTRLQAIKAFEAATGFAFA